MARHQRRDQRGDVAPPEARGRGDAQVSVRARGACRHGRLGLFQLGEQGARGIQEAGAGVGQRQPARTAMHQPGGQALLQRVDTFAHHVGRHPFAAGRGGKAAVQRHGNEGFELFVVIHGAIPEAGRNRPSVPWLYRHT